MNSHSGLTAVFDHIDSHADQYIDRLKDLCRQETIASERKGIMEGAERVAALLKEINAEPQLVPVEDTFYVVTRMAGSGDKTLGFYNHLDTHPAGDLDQWISPPFEPTLRDGSLYARGATDNKGNVIARICAVEAYLHVFDDLPLDILFLHDTEEEIGSPYMGTFVNQYSELVDEVSGWVWEGGFKNRKEELEVYLGFNGLLYVDLEVQTASEDTHGRDAAMVPNAVWRLVWALSTLKGVDEDITIDGFTKDLEPISEEERELVKSIPFDKKLIMEEFGIHRFAGDSDVQEVLERQYLRPYMNISGIRGGYLGEGMQAILPHLASTKLELYLAGHQNPDTVKQQLESHLKARGFDDIQLKILAKIPPSRTSASSGLARSVVELIGELYDKPAALYPIMPGASPMGYLTTDFGVPGISTGVGYSNSRIHQSNENVRLEDFIQGIKLMAALIHRMGQPDQRWD